jgi:hypothetical protein
VLTIYLFDEVLGPKFNARDLPVMDAFFQRMQGDARSVLVAAKNATLRSDTTCLNVTVNTARIVF